MNITMRAGTLAHSKQAWTRVSQPAYPWLAIGVGLALFLSMLLLLEVGRQIGQVQLARLGEGSRVGVGVVDGAIFGLLGLILGFSFSGAATRFNERRQLVITEVNAISTAWQRITLLPESLRAPVQNALRRYVDAILGVYAEKPLSDDMIRRRVEAAQVQEEVWVASMGACLNPDGEKARMLLLPSINAMFDAVDVERLMRRIHSPPIILMMLVIVALVTSIFAGYALATGPRNWMYMIGAAAAISVATYVIMELEFPRAGLIRVDAMDQALMELRSTMN